METLELEDYGHSFDYVTKVVDGLESLLLNDLDGDKGNQGLVKGILSFNGLKIETVEGTEGFVDWLKNAIATIYKSIKNFLKSIYDALFGRSKKRKELDDAIGKIKAAGNIRFEFKAKPFNNDHLKGFEERMASARKRAEENLRQADKHFEDILNRMGDSIKAEWEFIKRETSNSKSWAESAKERTKRAGVIIDLAETEWKEIDKEVEKINTLLIGVSDDMPKAEQDAKRKELDLYKKSLNERGRVAAMATDYANKVLNQVEKEAKEVEKEIND